MSIYEKAFEKSDVTDAVLLVDGKKLYVNKALLSSQSDYFKMLFEEKLMEEIPIEDVNFEDFATVLSLVHSNRIEPTAERIHELLKIADRFQLPSAKHQLEEFLKTSNQNSRGEGRKTLYTIPELFSNFNIDIDFTKQLNEHIAPILERCLENYEEDEEEWFFD